MVADANLTGPAAFSVAGRARLKPVNSVRWIEAEPGLSWLTKGESIGNLNSKQKGFLFISASLHFVSVHFHERWRNVLRYTM
jgi:hypothetical protein